MSEPVGRPAYQQVADDLRQKMASGELPVGAAIPSTAQMTRQYGVSSTVVRAAVSQLRSEGLLVGQPGKGVFVRALPGAASGHTVAPDDLAMQIAELREDLAVMRRCLADVYQHVGLPLPGDLAAEASSTGQVGH